MHEAHLKETDYTFRSYATETQVLDALALGTVDLALGPFYTREDLAPFIDANDLDFLYPVMIPDDGIAMAVCRGNTELLDSLNAALDAMRTDGTLAALEDRWF